MQPKEKTLFTFNNFAVDAERRLLLKQGEVVNLNSKAFDLLLVLIKNRGRILSKNDLLDKVWEGQFVEENNLTVQISALRKIFGERKGEHQFIATIPGKGYKFIGGKTSLVGVSQTLDSTVKTVGGDEEIIGREAEIAEIKAILCSSDKCLLTLTGAGGSGKTTLAKTIAEQMQTEFADGVFFVELAAVNQSELFITTLAKTLNLEEVSANSLLENVKNFLHNRRILLILDNFEQLLVAANLLKEIYDFAANLKIIVTSRAPLHLKSEREKSVVPLAVPPNENLSVEQLNAFSAVELFIARARTMRENFRLNEENAPFVAEICRRLDGLPLAVELAAARGKLLSPQAIALRLENSLKLLTGGANDLSERQRTMRGAIQWSYDLLDENEQNLFRRLAIFAGGFTVEAAEAVAEGEKGRKGEGETAWVLDLLTSLIDHNLLVSKEQADGSMRLQMLEVVREFALECLETSNELSSLQRAHARYFLNLAEKAETFLHGDVSDKWLEKLESEHDNFRAALGWSLKNESETAARIAAALRFFWANHSHLSEGLKWSKAALQATENKLSTARSKLLLSNGLFLRNRGELESARQLYEQCLTESRRLNDAEQINKAFQGLGSTAVLQKDFDSAQIFYNEALALCRESGDETQLLYTLGCLGDLEMSREDFQVARPPLEESLRLSLKHGNKRVQMVIYYNLGTIDYLENKGDSARFNFSQSLRLAQEMGNNTMISCTLDGFAALNAGNGNAVQSAKLAGAADFLRESIGYRVEPAEEIFREKYLAKTLAALSLQDFTKAYEAGRRLNFADSIALTEFRDFDFADDSDDETSEIIVETHQFERIIIEEETVEIKTVPPRQLKTLARLSPKVIYSGIIILFLTIILGAWFWRDGEDSRLKPFRFTKLTNSGKITNATMTPDGSYAVFSQTEEDGESLRLKHIATGSQNQILKTQPVNFVGLTTSPDGNFIYATVFSGDFPDPQVWRIPILGGAVEHIQGITTGATVSLSPDSTRMAFTESRSSLKETHLGIADSNGTNKRILVRAKDDERSFPNFASSPVAWSADGEKIACIIEQNTSDGARKAGILLINTNDGSERFLSEKRWDYIDNIAWIDAENIVLSASTMNQGQIWTVSGKTGEVRQITTDLNSYSWIAAGGKNILTVQKNIVSKVSIANFDEATQKLQSREVFAESGYISYVNWTADGKILYTSTASRKREIWRVNSDGTDKTQLTVNADIEFGLSVSPTDGSLLFCLSKEGKNSLHLTDSEGKNIRPLLEGMEDVWGNFTPDGRSVIFQRGLNNKTLTLWRYDLADGKLSQLTQTNAIFPTISPDGTQTAFYFMDAKTDNLWRIGFISTRTGEFSGKINLPKEATQRRMRWHPGGKSITQAVNEGEEIKLLFLPLDGSIPSQTFDLGKGDLQWFEWSLDGKKIVVSQSTQTQDIVLLNQ